MSCAAKTAWPNCYVTCLFARRLLFYLKKKQTLPRRIGQTRKMCFRNANCEDCEDCLFWEGEFPSLVKSYRTRRLDAVLGGSWWQIYLHVLGNVVWSSLIQSPNFTTKDFQAVLSQEPNSIWILKPCQLGEGRHIEILRFSGDTNNPHTKRSCFKSGSKMKQKTNHFACPRCHVFHFYSMIVRWARKTADLMLKRKDQLAF